MSSRPGSGKGNLPNWSIDTTTQLKTSLRRMLEHLEILKAEESAGGRLPEHQAQLNEIQNDVEGCSNLRQPNGVTLNIS